MNAIELKNIVYTYSKNTPFENTVLNGINIAFEAGKINGLIRPDSGEVLLFGKNIWDEPKKIKDVRFRVGLVFQYPEYQLFEETCEKDIAFGPSNMGLDEKEIKRRVKDAAEFVGLSSELLQKSPFELSGGQKRRVALAGIMAMEPEVLILDEPAAGLDPIGRTDIFGGIRRYQRINGNTVIIVSHSMEDMAEYCDDLSVLKKGELRFSGKCGEVFANEAELESMGLSVPQITKFMRLLREGGMPVRNDIYTIDEAYREIKRLLGENN